MGGPARADLRPLHVLRCVETVGTPPLVLCGAVLVCCDALCGAGLICSSGAARNASGFAWVEWLVDADSHTGALEAADGVACGSSQSIAGVSVCNSVS